MAVTVEVNIDPGAKIRASGAVTASGYVLSADERYIWLREGGSKACVLGPYSAPQPADIRIPRELVAGIAFGGVLVLALPKAQIKQLPQRWQLEEQEEQTPAITGEPTSVMDAFESVIAGVERFSELKRRLIEEHGAGSAALISLIDRMQEKKIEQGTQQVLDLLGIEVSDDDK